MNLDFDDTLNVLLCICILGIYFAYLFIMLIWFHFRNVTILCFVFAFQYKVHSYGINFVHLFYELTLKYYMCVSGSAYC